MPPQPTPYEINVLEQLKGIRHSLEWLAETAEAYATYFTGECEHRHVLPSPKDEPEDGPDEPEDGPPEG
jgi:hypothetical protein